MQEPEPLRDLLARLGWGPAERPLASAGTPMLSVSRGASSPPRCATAVLINGEPADGMDASVLLLSTAELRAVEYHRAEAVPAELATAGGCDVVVLWTR